MTAIVFKKETQIPCPADELFRWHEQPDAFSKLIPPGEPVKLLHHDGHIRNGARAVVLAGLWPVRFRWELEHSGYISGEQFCDVQIKGPFKSWRHVHRMIAIGPHSSMLADHITFEMPFGFIGQAIGKLIILPKLKRLFEYRHQVTIVELSR